MSERVCPECGGRLELLETHQDPDPPGQRMTYACSTDGCTGGFEEVSEYDAAAANEPTGGDNIGA